VKGAQEGVDVQGTRDAIVERLRGEATGVADAFARQLHETHPLYRGAGDPDLLSRSHGAALGALITFAAWLERGTRSLDPAERDYLGQEAADSAAQLFPLEAIVEPVRMGVWLLWQWIVDACAEFDNAPALTLDLLEELTHFQLELQRVLTGSYVEARFQPDDEEREAQHELLELLLAGKPVTGEVRARLVTDYGLGAADPCVVLVADSGTGPAADVASSDAIAPTTAITQATAIARQRPANRRWLVSERSNEVVAVVAVTGSVDETVTDVGVWLHHLRRVHNIDLRAGLSTPGDLPEVPDRYIEAREGLRLSDDHPERLGALSRVRLFDYLTSRFDLTARRLVPTELQRLRHEDERVGRVLSQTLVALAEADLNVRRAASALYVHPNTVHYRLRRIAELTGHDPRRFRDLVDLLAALRCSEVEIKPPE
jgi:hypothetical protein